MSQAAENHVSDRIAEHRARVTPQALLIVDDLRSSRMLLEALLQKTGHRTNGCDRAERALDLLSSERYAAVVVDVHMPGMDGIQLEHAIRAMAPTELGSDPQLPVIFITADETMCRMLSKQTRQQGVCLSKPATVEALCEVLERAWGLDQSLG